MRAGCAATASQLADECQLKDLVDIHIFQEASPVIEGLRKHDCAAALAWCQGNHVKLRKAKSRLEFKLRMQEFVELIRADNLLAAVSYAQKYLACYGSSHMAELQQAAALLAFRVGTGCHPYAALLSEDRWPALQNLFLQDLFRLHHQPPRSLLDIHLQAGLSAMKTPHSYRNNASKEDPMHHEAFQRLAEGLPRAKHVHSKLVCHVTGQMMDEHNLPMVMPNGTVYSEAAVKLLTRPDGHTFMCPKTGVTCNVSDLQRAFMP
ncbi:hypothetical protein WJX73_006713 [Symbiochloris irregularis]